MKAEKNKKKRMPLVLAAALLIVVLVLAAAIVRLAVTKEGDAAPIPEKDSVQGTEKVLEHVPTEARKDPIILNDSLVISDAGSYTGIYMEDGTDDPVTGVLKIVVTNVSEEPVQYAQINLDVEGETASFSVTALPAGASAVLLEHSRMKWREDVDYMSVSAKCEAMAMFDRELSLQEDKLKIQTLDGALNITNISGEDITDTIILCYKGYQNDMYYGGIAYRIRLQGGLKAGELRQIIAEHFQEPGSRMVFAEFAAQ